MDEIGIDGNSLPFENEGISLLFAQVMHGKPRMEINEDGTKLFLVYHGAGSEKPRLLEYALSTPYDLTTISLNLNAGIPLDGQGVSNPMGIRFSPNGKRIWIR